jgi:L-ascorbate metabolism protein UlaG (beta-lactamase superfamily)
MAAAEYRVRMHVQKLEHACLIVREGHDALVIDPGNFTTPVELTGAVAVVLTHEHPDHADPEQLRRILTANPDIPVIGPAGVAVALSASMPNIAVDVVSDGDSRTVGPFAMTFHGTKHQLIHSSVPVIDNTGVIVNDALFYGGDAYTVPAVPVHTVAAPVGAPWLKVSEMMDWIAELRPERTFPTHEHTLSADGFAMAAQRLAEATTAAGGEPVVLRPGEVLEL